MEVKIKKKSLYKGIALAAIIIFIVVAYASFFRSEPELIVLNREKTIPEKMCSERGLDDKIIVLESKYCSACREAVPKIKEVGSELSVDIIYLDLSEQNNVDRMNDFGVTAKYTPTLLAGCDVHIGAKSKEAYSQIISEFLAG